MATKPPHLHTAALFLGARAFSRWAAQQSGAPSLALLGLASLVGLQDSYPEEVLIAEPIDPKAEIAREYRAGYERRVRTLSPFAHGVSDAKLPRAVMFRDSFGNALVPYLSEHFRRILYVWNRDVDPRVVGVEKPDIVIQQIVGRFLGRRPRGIQELETADSQ